MLCQKPVWFETNFAWKRVFPVALSDGSWNQKWLNTLENANTHTHTHNWKPETLWHDRTTPAIQWISNLFKDLLEGKEKKCRLCLWNTKQFWSEIFLPCSFELSETPALRRMGNYDSHPDLMKGRLFIMEKLQKVFIDTSHWLELKESLRWMTPVSYVVTVSWGICSCLCHCKLNTMHLLNCWKKVQHEASR